MAVATPAELQQLLVELNNEAKLYDGSGGALEAETRANIRAQARKVFLAMMSPEEMGLYHLLDFMELISIRVCIELGVFLNMPEDRPISLQDLSAAVDMQPAFLERILRTLIVIGFVNQTDAKEYTHTKFSLDYRDPTTPSSGALFKSCYYIFLTNHNRFHEYITTTLPKPYPEPDNIYYNSINWHLGTSGQSWFVPISQKPDIAASFHAGLSGLDIHLPSLGPFTNFNQFIDTSDPERTQIVDVGGGAGHSLVKILRATPDLDPTKCVLQDLAGALDLATEPKELGVQIMPHDFHSDQPVKGAKVYYLRYILHDYGDAQTINILTRVARAMSADSVVLIVETVMPERLTEAALAVEVVDSVMLAMGGKERTVKEYQAVFEASGLRMTETYPVPGRTGMILEGRLALKQ